MITIIYYCSIITLLYYCIVVINIMIIVAAGVCA